MTLLKIFHQEIKHGLVLDTSIINKHCAFLKRMYERFPSPKAQSLQTGIEGIENVTVEHGRNICDVAHYDFFGTSQ